MLNFNPFVVPNPKYYNYLKRGKTARWLKPTEVLKFGDNFPPSLAYWRAIDGRPMSLPPLPPRQLTFEKSIELYDYQKEVFDQIKDKRSGMVVLPTGGGKTVLASKLIEYHGYKTLIVCHSRDLVLQFQETIKNFLGYDAGVYMSGKKQLKDITITTYASFNKNTAYFSNYSFGCLIVDECDLATTRPTMANISEFSSFIKYSFTATPLVEKYDNYIKKGEPSFLERFWGYTVVGKTDNQEDILEKVVIKNYQKKYTDKYGLPIRANDWQTFRPILDSDIDRKLAMLKFIKDQRQEGDYTLVLVDRVEDVEWFSRELECYKLHGSMSKKDREENNTLFKENGGVIVGNYKILGRGWDCKQANKAFILMPVKSEANMKQALGRIIRYLEGKKSILYLWEDSSLSFQSKKKLQAIRDVYPLIKIENEI